VREVESGEIALSVDDVERIDAGTSVAQRMVPAPAHHHRERL